MFVLVEHHEDHDTTEELPLPHQEEAAGHPTTQAAVVSESSEVPSTTEAEESVKEPELPQENDEAKDMSGVQEPSAEYHEVPGEATHAPEDENDYDGTNAGDEDEFARSGADQVHDTIREDTDAAATATGHGSEFGGEQIEYPDYVQPEEYDERYGEELPERAGGASPVQYGEPPHDEEEGEQDTSTAVDETQTVLPGSDEDGEDKSAVTPIPAHAVLESESSEHVDANATNESVSRTSIFALFLQHH